MCEHARRWTGASSVTIAVPGTPCVAYLRYVPLLHLQATASSVERSLPGAVQDLSHSWASRSSTLVSVLEGAAMLQRLPSTGAPAGAAGRLSRSGSLHHSTELRSSGDLGVQVLGGTVKASASLAEQQGLRQSTGDAGSALGRARLPPLPGTGGWGMRKSSTAAEQAGDHGQLVPAGSGNLRASLTSMLGRSGSGAEAGAGAGAGAAAEGDGGDAVASVALTAGGVGGKGGAAGEVVALVSQGKSLSGGLAAGAGPRGSNVMQMLA